MDCNCPIWAAGRTSTGDIPRQSTGTRDLKTAEAIVAALISTDKKKQAAGPSIEECIEKYLASYKSELGEKTHGQYKLHLGRLQQYCERQWKATDLCKGRSAYWARSSSPMTQSQLTSRVRG